MSDSTTVARPYAKAIFEQAMHEKKLAEWSEYLLILAQATLSPLAQEFIHNPASQTSQQIDLLQSVCASQVRDSSSLNNLIALLAANKRLMLLPEIKVLYEVHRAEQEKTLSVDVVSFSEMSDKQEKQLAESLTKRLQRQVSLNISIDTSILGGAIVRAGDLVIDGSVRGKLNKLASGLAA